MYQINAYLHESGGGTVMFVSDEMYDSPEAADEAVAAVQEANPHVTFEVVS